MSVSQLTPHPANDSELAVAGRNLHGLVPGLARPIEVTALPQARCEVAQRAAPFHSRTRTAGDVHRLFKQSDAAGFVAKIHSRDTDVVGRMSAQFVVGER